MLALALMAPVVSAASELASLLDLPVAGTVLVAAAQYHQTPSRSGSPVDIALGIAGPFEGARQLIAQANEGAESPSASRVTVIRDGLLDDALRAERWDIHLGRTAAAAGKSGRSPRHGAAGAARRRRASQPSAAPDLWAAPMARKEHGTMV